MAEITADAEHLQPKHRSSDDALAQCFPPGEASVSHLPRMAPIPFYPKGLPKTRCSPTNPFPTDSTVWTSTDRNRHYVIEHNFPLISQGYSLNCALVNIRFPGSSSAKPTQNNFRNEITPFPRGVPKSCASFIPKGTLDNTCHFWPPPAKNKPEPLQN